MIAATLKNEFSCFTHQLVLHEAHEGLLSETVVAQHHQLVQLAPNASHQPGRKLAVARYNGGTSHFIMLDELYNEQMDGRNTHICFP